MDASRGDQVELVRAAYEELFARVAAGRITESDPLGVLEDLSAEWRRPVAPRLAAQLLDYAREQLAVQDRDAPAEDRELVRRQRLYAVTQQVYDRIRLTAPGARAGAAQAS